MKNFSNNDLALLDQNVILLFGTKDCNPCQALKMKIDKWNRMEALYVSIEENREFAAQKDILSAPTILAYIEGQLVIRVSGYFSLDEQLNKLERYLEISA